MLQFVSSSVENSDAKNDATLSKYPDKYSHDISTSRCHTEHNFHLLFSNEIIANRKEFFESSDNENLLKIRLPHHSCQPT